MYKRDKREMRIERFAMRATIRNTKENMRHSEYIPVIANIKKIRIRHLIKLNTDKSKYMETWLAKWREETRRATTSARLNNN